MRRGEVWWADLSEPRGSEPGYIRPVLIIQDNHYNDSRLATVITIGLTSNLKYSQIPSNIQLPKSESGLPKDSIINLAHLSTINKDELTERVSAVPQLILDQVEHGLAIMLGMQ
ncbi:MAG: type II toxin-antitoxin system PemK/MazF family toxin [Okeania sp. SIO3B3]|nr:type II toxin-antitoxin system PemK/MazF family toxin [Okeania sp. SIO3B3]